MAVSPIDTVTITNKILITNVDSPEFNCRDRRKIKMEATEKLVSNGQSISDVNTFLPTKK